MTLSISQYLPCLSAATDAYAAARARKVVRELPEVTLSEDGEVRFLHLGTEWIQGSMIIADPFAIELDYVQRMMAWLLFVEPDSVGKRKAMQLARPLLKAVTDIPIPDDKLFDSVADLMQLI